MPLLPYFEASKSVDIPPPLPTDEEVYGTSPDAYGTIYEYEGKVGVSSINRSRLE